MTLEDIIPGTVGGQDWIYKVGAPFAFKVDASVKPENIYGMPYDSSQDIYESFGYISDEFNKYFTYDNPVDLENVVRENYPVTPIKSFKLAFEKFGDPNRPGDFYLMGYDGNNVGRVAFNDILVLDDDLNVKENFKVANVWRDWLDKGVGFFAADDQLVFIFLEPEPNDYNTFYAAGIPLFYHDDPNNRIQEYLVSPDPDPTNFGGVFAEGKSQKPIDPDTSGSTIEGLFEDPGFDLAYGPMRGVVLNDENIDKLAQKIGAGWFADNIGNAIISLKLIRLPGEINTTTNVDISIIPATKSWWGIGVDTPEVQGRYIKKQFQNFSFGKYTIEEKYNSFLDYSNTSVSLYLPFSGLHQLEPKTIIGSTIKVDCSIDLLTGSLIWYVTVVRDGVTQVLYEWSGNCSMEMVLSSIDYAQKVTQSLTGLVGITSSIAIGASTKNLSQASYGVVSGGIDIAKSMSDNHISIGNVSSNFGWSGIMYPFLVFSRTKTAYPSNYDENVGKPSMKNAKLSDLNGYTKVAEIHLDNIVCLEDERVELLRLLKDGVIL